MRFAFSPLGVDISRSYITLEMLGIESVKKDIKALKERPEAIEVWSTVAMILKAETLRLFQNECGPDGRAWKPLSAKTILARRKGKRKNLGTKILQDSGRLRGSISERYGAGWAEIGTTVKYAPVHQYGSKKRNIPARPFIGLSQVMADRIQATMLKWLEQGV